MDLNIILGEALLTLLSFLILLYVIYKFAWQPFNQMLETRQKKVADDWQAAEDAKKANQEALSQIESQLKSAHLEAEKIIRQAQIDASHLRDKMIEETRQEQSKMLQLTQEDLKVQRQNFAENMQESLVHMAVAMAGKVVRREISEDDHRQMIQEFINRLEELDEQR
ncbi:F0F1 ATP synthase subunit B [Facklamia miroungae]|uniref:ATP synthase subunit b n=1 Tax=Facklamia miroungae TaxID=120956 RepID=A0A1G7PES9_9LACT|nr:F0F1 ATP synthase subunit B [Facklamia miroungae]NKZ28688.1 F0F1 ATP synthase subunit B [Facklamia miroungae]SDF84806.1 F-type H+-transporting ATPase subunit b [Facklamia miroungae]